MKIKWNIWRKWLWWGVLIAGVAGFDSSYDEFVYWQKAGASWGALVVSVITSLLIWGCIAIATSFALYFAFEQIAKHQRKGRDNEAIPRKG